MRARVSIVVRTLLGMTAVEGLGVLGYLMALPADPKNAWLLGFSRQRALLMGISGLVALACVGLLIATRRAGSWAWIESRLASFSHSLWYRVLMLVLVPAALLGLALEIQLVFEGFGAAQAVMERLAPMIALASLAALQIFAGLVFLFPGDLAKEKPAFWAALAVWLLLLGLWLFICFTQMGIEPITGTWNVPGTPILAVQVGQVLAVGALFALFSFVLNRLYGKWGRSPWEARRFLWFDLVMCVGLWGITYWLWTSTPLSPTFFSPRPQPPNLEFYPYSDSRGYDIDAQFLLLGEGYGGNGGSLIIRPFYAFWVAILHALGGQSFFQMMNVQAALLATFPVFLYALGTLLHSRLAGVLAAGLGLLRETNSIALSGVINVTHARLLLTDLPTATGLSLWTLLLVAWMKEPQRRRWLPLAAGGVFGFLVLLRSQTAALLPVAVVLIVCVFWRRPRLWIQACLGLGIGAVLVVGPWIYRNVQVSGMAVLETAPATLHMGWSAQHYSFEPEKEDPTLVPMPGEKGTDYNSRMSRRMLDFALANPGETIRRAAGHFFHNEINFLLALPASVGQQDVQQYVKDHVFWIDEVNPLTTEEGLLLAVNLGLLAVGLGALVAQRRVELVLPLFFHLGYNATNAFALRSGWRFFLPVEWVLLLFWAIGLAQAGRWLVQAANCGKPWKTWASEASDFRLLSELVPWRQMPWRQSPKKGFAWVTPLLVGIALLAGGCTVAFVERWIPPHFELLNREQAVDLVHLRTANQPDAERLTQLMKSNQVQILVGRALYPAFYRGGDGIFEGFSPAPSMAVRDYNRLGFLLLGRGRTDIVLPLEESPDFFPNASDVIVLGCSRGDHVQAQAVVVMDSRDLTRDRVYVSETAACP